MKNLIPKSISKNKLLIWRNLGIVDILIILGSFSFSGLFVFGLPLTNWQKILANFLLALIAIPLILPISPPLKGWNVIFLSFKHFVLVKKYQKNSSNDTSLLVPYDKVVGKNFIKTQKINGKTSLIGCLSIKGFDITLLNYQEQELKIKELQDTLKFANFGLTFLKLETPLEFKTNINYYKQQLDELNNNKANEVRKKQLQEQIAFLEKDLIKNEAGIKTKKSFFIFVYGNKEKELVENINFVVTKLTNINFFVEQLDNFELVQTLHLIWNPYRDLITKAQFEANKDNLAEILSFNKFNLHKTYFTGDDIYYSINGIYQYPLKVSDLWGASLACNEQTIIWNINPLNANQMKIALNKAINNAYTKQVMTKSHINFNENAYEIEAYKELIDDVNGANEVVKNVNILFLNYGTSLKVLKQQQIKLKQNLQELNMKINPLSYQQLDGLNSFLPKASDPLMATCGQEMPCASLAISFPFLASGLRDDRGMYLGQTNMGDMVLFDPFKLDSKRKNHNQIIIGTSGSGKSFVTKKIISFHLNMNRTVIVIDPEREYQKLARFYQGQWIDTGDAVNGKINPLQVLDNTFDNQNCASVSNHLRFLSHWFKTLYPDFNDREMSLLIKNLKQLYQNFNITNKTNINQLANNQFPTMQDFVTLLENDTNPCALLTEFIAIIKTDFGCDGKYEKLWNGYTTLNFNNSFIVYDVLTLFEQDDSKIIACQLHLMLAFIKKEVKANRFVSQNKIVIVIDEAHLAIDKDNPAALNFIYQMVKRIRKYNGSIIITTQNLNDFSGSQEIKKKVSAIINNTQYSLIFNLAPQDLKDVADLYASYGGLTSSEKDYIARANKGQALFVVSGYERYCLNVEASESEQEGFE